MIEQGESVDMGTRTGEGLTIQRDELVEDVFQIDNHGDELSRDEIKRLAELAGFEVSEE